MKPIHEIIQECLGSFEEKDFSLPFEQLGIDSFALVELRVCLEHNTQHQIPDGDWVNFKSVRDIENYYEKLF